MSTWPPIAAGQRVTAALLTSMLPQTVVKQAHTDRASTIIFSADPELTAPLEADAIYRVEFDLIAGAVTAGDIQTRWSLPVSASGLRIVNGPGSAAVDANADNIATRQGVHQFSPTTILYNGVRNSTSNYFRIYEYAIVTMGDAGNVTLEWTQGTSSPTATRVAAGSVLRVRRIG